MDLVSARILEATPRDTKGKLQLSSGDPKVTCAFSTAQGLAPLTPGLFKCQLYSDL